MIVETNTAARIVVSASILAFAVAVGSPPTIAQNERTYQAHNQILVGRNIHVSTARGNDDHYETVLAVNPQNQKDLLAASMVYSEEKNTGSITLYTSFDSGQTWSLALNAYAEENLCCPADPAVAYGPDETAYLVYFGPTPGGNFRMTVYRSKDGGRTWFKSNNLPAIDRPFIVIDDTKGKNGPVHITGVKILEGFDALPIVGGAYNAFSMYRSLDGGITFEISKDLISVDNHWIFGNAPGVVLSDGSLVFVFGELQDYKRDAGFEERPSKPNARLKAITSADGGENFSKAVTITEYAIPFILTSTIVPSLAADRSGGPFRDRLYTAYPNVSSGRVEILFSYSPDKGKSWSKPVRLDDDTSAANPPRNGGDRSTPTVAVNRDGVVGVAWYDPREGLNNLDWTVRFVASLDGGETFLPSVKVSEAAFRHDDKDIEWLVRASGRSVKQIGKDPTLNDSIIRLDLTLPSGFPYFRGGDTAGLVADVDGVFHPLWVDNRTNISQVWTAPVTVKGTAIRNGSTELANLENLSEKVVIRYTNTRYDRGTNKLSVDAQLLNVSNDTIIGPVKARVLRLSSEMGISRILKSENSEGGVGAVWDFTSLLKDGLLRPNEKSELKRLEFIVSDLQPLRPYPIAAHRGLGLVRIEAKLFGKVAKESERVKPATHITIN